MNLRQLELFVAVAETGSFSRGAEAVSLTQSTVSQHIAALEEEAGTPLFDRTARGALLTTGGELFLRHARRILAERDALGQAMTGFRGLQQAALTIGASNIPAHYLVPPLLPQLAAAYPGIALTMRTGDSLEILDQLAAAELELGLVGYRFDHQGLEFTPLVSDPLVLVVGPGHSWRQRPSLPLAELAGAPLVVREQGSGSGRTLESALQEAGLPPSALQVAARLGSNEAIQQAVAAGFGCAFISRLSARQRLARGELVAVTVEGFRVERQIWLARLAARSVSPAARAFAGLLRERLGP